VLYSKRLEAILHCEIFVVSYRRDHE